MAKPAAKVQTAVCVCVCVCEKQLANRSRRSPIVGLIEHEPPPNNTTTPTTILSASSSSVSSEIIFVNSFRGASPQVAPDAMARESRLRINIKAITSLSLFISTDRFIHISGGINPPEMCIALPPAADDDWLSHTPPKHTVTTRQTFEMSKCVLFRYPRLYINLVLAWRLHN